ncbi:hypothetical protein NA57DRAFT_71579 [Rhizodiscina lignyota]|uniref:Homeobox domain-containing protein n=1 Tax=Rhizodiscina lignyota TaxID=1504668 RepID=A0A9P4IJ57_9PEZI|nr:hypothetical protein NA57DRAFT_71579 [Rhizodiscina lignyota]
MAFSMNSRPLSPISYHDEESSYLNTFEVPYPAGPEAWTLFNEHSNDLQHVGMAFATQDFYQNLEAVAEPNWDAGQCRRQRLPENDYTSPAGLSIYTDGQVSSVDEVPILTATDTSVTTTGTSPEEFRSPVRTTTNDEQPSPLRHTGRNFHPSSIAPLREWFDQNLNDPYPSKEIKEMLAARSGLEPRQVNNWFINARKRQLPRPGTGPVVLHDLTSSPESLSTSAFAPHPSTSMASYPPFGMELEPLVEQEHNMPTNLWPTSAPHGLLSTQNIFQSGPQSDLFRSPSSAGSHAAASPSDFHLPFPSSNTTSPSSTIIPRTPSNTSFTSQLEPSPLGFTPRRGLRRHFRGARPGPRRSPVTSSGPTSNSNRSPAHDNSDSHSDHDHGTETPASSRSGEIFQCTFPNCGKSFSSKTWKRHEETKHLPRFQWTCMATGFIIQHTSPTTTPNPAFSPFSFGSSPAVYTQTTSCAFCGKLNPDPQTHAQECEHRLSDCLCRPGAERTFTRKDHLFQHLRNFHRFTPADTSFGAEWKSKVEYSNRSWGCGFCGERLSSWEKRARHLRTHFREGWRVEDGWDDRKVKGYGYGGGYR